MLLFSVLLSNLGDNWNRINTHQVYILCACNRDSMTKKLVDRVFLCSCDKQPYTNSSYTVRFCEDISSQPWTCLHCCSSTSDYLDHSVQALWGQRKVTIFSILSAPGYQRNLFVLLHVLMLFWVLPVGTAILNPLKTGWLSYIWIKPYQSQDWHFI